MTTTLGTGELTYKPVDGWAKLPDGWTFHECPGVGVDSKDNVYVLTRSEHPVIVFDKDGNFLRSWGEGMFGRTHGVHITADDSIYIADDERHVVRKFTPEGRLLQTLGTEDTPKPAWGGEPFNKPTHVAVSPVTGDLYITDGYGNSRVHSFTADGVYRFSWGSPGIDPGQFQRPHNIVIDKDDNIYVADRENHRVQVFNNKGELQAVWQNIFRPDGICLGADNRLYVGELCQIPGLETAPGLGHRVSIYDLQGNREALFGDPVWGDAPGQFVAPHGIAIDSRGNLYVGEASYTIKGKFMDPPQELRSFQKLELVK